MKGLYFPPINRDDAGMRTPMIILRPMGKSDIAVISHWPPYGAGFAQMDYALRENGWLEEFSEKPGTWCYIAVVEREPVGFSILSTMKKGEAEFRIALHPNWTGRGVGAKIARATLEQGFLRLGFDSIRLIVRKNNLPARALYEKLGIEISGECTRLIKGQPIEFFEMSTDRQRFQHQTTRQERRT